MNLLILIVIFIIIYKWLDNNNKITESDIIKMTDLWCDKVTKNNDPEAIYKLFCKDGNLVGTVSQVKRRGIDIKRYFNYFAKLPNIRVLNKEYIISKVTPDVFINTAFITWHWKGLKQPIVARMTFVYRNKCIFQLHSSKLPELNEKLLEISELH